MDRQVEERILLLISIPGMLLGFVFGCILIVNVFFTKSLHKPRHLFQALSVLSSLLSEIFGLYGLVFLARSCGFFDFTPRVAFYFFIWNRYLLLFSDVLPSIDRLVAILYPLKYHVYASCRAGKIICIITIFLTGLLTLLSFLAGVIPAHIGEKAMDHFLLISSKKFVMSLTLPFTVFLVICLIGDSTALCVALSQLKKQKTSSSCRTATSTTEDLTMENLKPASPSSAELKVPKTQSQKTLSVSNQERRSVQELKISMRCLGLTVWFFLSQLCTYTPGVVFYQCGDGVTDPGEPRASFALPLHSIKETQIGNQSHPQPASLIAVNGTATDRIDEELIINNCDMLLSCWPRIFIFFFYQIQFIKSLFIMGLDKSLKDSIIQNMTRKLYVGNS